MKKGLMAGFLLPSFVCILSAFAQSQVCEIKYGERKVDIRRNASASFRSEINNSNSFCYQIGNEVDKWGKSLDNKPIFACCR